VPSPDEQKPEEKPTEPTIDSPSAFGKGSTEKPAEKNE
jgi:hypothetical protein